MKKVFFLVFMCLVSWNAVAASCSYNKYSDCKSATEYCYWDFDNEVCNPCGKNAVPNTNATHCNCIDGYVRDKYKKCVKIQNNGTSSVLDCDGLTKEEAANLQLAADKISLEKYIPF